jgi:hypothetical protein
MAKCDFPKADDGSDRVAYEMARQYLARCVANPLRVAAELARYRDAAQRLVRSAWAQTPHSVARQPPCWSMAR